MLKRTLNPKYLVFFLLFICSCATLRKEYIEIPKDVNSEAVVKEIPKEQQKEPDKITVVSSDHIKEDIVKEEPKKTNKVKGKSSTANTVKKPEPLKRVVKNPFKIGEKIRWDLYYIGIKAATLTVEIKPFVELNGKKAFHFNGVAETTSLMKYIYRVYDVIDSYVDYESFVPLKMTLTMNESKQNVSMVLNYDHVKGRSKFWKKRIDSKRVATETKRNDEFTPMAQDIFSALYYMRTHELKVGDKVKYVVHDNGKNWNMTLSVVKEEKIWTRLGDVNSVLIHPTVERNGEKFTKGSMYIWVTNDERKIPLKFEAEVKIGSMKGYIKDYIVPKK